MRTTVTDALVLTLYAAAARADATPEQVEALRRQVMPVLEGVYLATGDQTPVRAVIRSVMGQGWRPAGQWAEQIRRLGGEV